MAARGVGRFQTAKVFLHDHQTYNEAADHVRCWSLSNSEGVSPSRQREALMAEIQGVGRFQTAKVFLLKYRTYYGKHVDTVLVAFKQRRCFSLPSRLEQEATDAIDLVLVAFKQRRCFSLSPTTH